jgi:hypothetical protein
MLQSYSIILNFQTSTMAWKCELILSIEHCFLSRIVKEPSQPNSLSC